MGWEYRTGWTVLWVGTLLLIPQLTRGRLRLQAGICLALVVFGLGGAAVFQSLPGFRLFRLPSRMFLITSLPIALLVGTATQALFAELRRNPGLSRTLGRILLLLVLVGLATTASITLVRGSLESPPLFVYWGSLLLTLPLAFWLLGRATSAGNGSARRTDERFQLAWGALLIADLWAMVWPLVEVRPQSQVYAPPSCVQLLMEERNEHDRVLDRAVPGQWERTPLGFALPLLHRLEQVRGYNPLDIHRYKEFVQFISDLDEPVPPANGFGNFPVINRTLLDLLGTRFLLQPSALGSLERETSDLARDPRWQRVGEDPAPEVYLFVSGIERKLPPYTLYENREAFPRAFVVPRAEPLPGRSGVLNALKTSDLRRVVLLEDYQADPGDPGPTGRFQPARIVAYQPNHVVIDVRLDAPGFLVLTDPWYPGWTCTLDGRPARLYRADYVFRGVAVPAGDHQVRFDFQPVSLRIGRMISAASLAAVLVLSLIIILGRIRCRPGNRLVLNRVQPGYSMSEGTR
jgi:hypothetical protein